MLDWLSNNDGNLATSDISQIMLEIIEKLQVGCRELLELLKPIFDRWEHNPSKVLSLLAETPLSLLRTSGRSWAEIEALLAERAATPAGALDATDRRLMCYIELVKLTGQAALETWKWEVARDLFLPPRSWTDG